MISTTLVQTCNGGLEMQGQPGGGVQLLNELQAGAIFGWRKRCLYLLVMVATVLIILNISLTVWAIRVLDLSAEGPGILSLTHRGMRVNGDAQFLDLLQAQKIRTESESGLKFESSRDVRLESGPYQRRAHNAFTLGSGVLESRGNHFLVRNPSAGVLFRTDPGEVVVAADNLRISTRTGFQLDGSLHAEIVRGSSRKDLRVESPHQTVNIQGDEEVIVQSRTDDADIISLEDIVLHARNGKAVLECNRLEMKNLIVSRSSSRNASDIFQVCSCENGRVFLAPREGACRATDTMCTDEITYGLPE